MLFPPRSPLPLSCCARNPVPTIHDLLRASISPPLHLHHLVCSSFVAPTLAIFFLPPNYAFSVLRSSPLHIHSLLCGSFVTPTLAIFLLPPNYAFSVLRSSRNVPTRSKKIVSFSRFNLNLRFTVVLYQYGALRRKNNFHRHIRLLQNKPGNIDRVKILSKTSG